MIDLMINELNFPSFSEGLSLRVSATETKECSRGDFPSFSEGLSLRVLAVVFVSRCPGISLPFRRDFH